MNQKTKTKKWVEYQGESIRRTDNFHPWFDVNVIGQPTAWKGKSGRGRGKNTLRKRFPHLADILLSESNTHNDTHTLTLIEFCKFILLSFLSHTLGYPPISTRTIHSNLGKWRATKQFICLKRIGHQEQANKQVVIYLCFPFFFFLFLNSSNLSTLLTDY